MRPKPFRLFSRAAMTLLLALFTAQTAWAQGNYWLNVEPNYEGSAAVTIPVNYDYMDGGYHYTLIAAYFEAQFNHPDGFHIKWFSTQPDGGDIYLPGKTITLTTDPTTIYAQWDPWNGSGTASDPYRINTKEQLLLLAHRVNGTYGETAVEDGYSSKYFKLGADITFSHDDNEGDDYAENYEAIGGTIGGTIRYFRGTFDGANHTVSGIRIRKDGSGYQGLFGCTDGADIHDVHLTDARIKGNEHVGGIAGYNDAGYIMRCSVTDSYITAVDDYGTICGINDGTLRNNYYHGCTVNGTAVTSGKGCIGADLTANNGALPAYRLDLGANITTPPGTFAGQTVWLDTPPVSPRLAPENGFTLAGNHYFASGYEFTPGSTLASGAAQGYTPRATLGGELLALYTPTGDADPLAGKAIARLSITADCDGKTLAAALRSDGLQHDVSYMIADGSPQTAQAIALDGTETTLGQDYQNTWYYVGTDISYSGTINCNGNVNIILADGKTMEINSSGEAIMGADDLTIYGQALGTGSLTATSTASVGIKADGFITINGGQVTATGTDITYNTATSDVGIRSVDGVTINGGTVTATGIMADGNVTINGGKVTTTDDPGILSNSGNIILGWTSPANRITADSYISYSGTVKVADGQGLTDGSGTSYSGTLTAGDINGKTLKPHWAGNGSSDSPYIISRPQELDLLAYRVNGTHGETLQSDGYSGKYFRLGADITYNHSTDWDDATSEENNYEAIGGYYGSTYRYFRGDFDGAGHTISGIRIHRSGTGYANSDQGIFGQTDGANIHGLRLADARITGYDDTGGIVGFNDGTVTDCHVASNVCIHTVQSGACYHGGIAGYNYGGTVENCTSAATLTIASSATSCGDYGAIAGYNYATLSDNLAIGTTVPATGNNSYGAIVGRNYGTLQRNYYTACKVASENVTPSDVGCANADVAEMTKSNVTYYDGAVPALRDQADNTQAIALLAALASTTDDHTSVDLGWGEGKYPMQLAGRTLYKDGSWNTLCLPFSVDLTASGTLSGDNVQAMTLNTATSTFADGTLTLNFTDATGQTIPAGTPFIIKWDESGTDIENPVFEGVTVSNATNDATVEGVLTFTGTYAPVSIADGGDNTKLYLGAANTLYYPNAAMTIGTHRAYFQLLGGITAGDPASGVRAFVLNFGDETTGIVSAEANSSLFTLHFQSGTRWMAASSLASPPAAASTSTTGSRS